MIDMRRVGKVEFDRDFLFSDDDAARLIVSELCKQGLIIDAQVKGDRVIYTMVHPGFEVNETMFQNVPTYTVDIETRIQEKIEKIIINKC